MWQQSGSTAGKAAAARESGSCPVSQPQQGTCVTGEFPWAELGSGGN